MHIRTVAPIMAAHMSYGMPLGRCVRRIMRFRFQGREERLCLSGHEGLQQPCHGDGFPLDG
jgi:hypothetical protein